MEWNGRMSARRSETDRFGMRVGTREVTIGSGTTLEVRVDGRRARWMNDVKTRTDD